jgi:hypothetical protein
LFDSTLFGVVSMATVCPVSRKTFLESARPVEVLIGGQLVLATMKEFGTGSFGWNVNGKATIMVDGKAVTVQVSGNLTAIGSKELPK